MTAKPKPLNVQKTLTQAQTAARKGDMDTARAGYRAILDRFPGNARAQTGLQDIERLLARQQRPELTQALVDAMFQTRAQGHHAEALAEARLLASAYPDRPVLQNFLAICLFEDGDIPRGIEACRKAIKLDPDMAEAHLNLSLGLLRNGEAEAALASGLTALRLRPTHTATLGHVAMIRDRLNQPDEAITLYKKATGINPRATDVWNNLGNLMKSLGRNDEAVDAFQHAIELAPRNGEIHCNLSALITYQSDTPHLAQMVKLEHDSRLPVADQMALHFALAKARQDSGDIDGAFASLVTANRLRKSLYPYTPQETSQQFASVKAAFANGSAPASPRPAKSSSPAPIFIVGLPRSGTTLVEQILASHGSVFGADELTTMTELLMPMLGNDTLSDPNEVTRIRDTYSKTIQALSHGEPYITDKMPTNFIWCGFLLHLFAGAKILHLTRDSVATCWSMFKQRFSSTGTGFAYDLDDLADYTHQYRDLMAFWHDRFPGQILDVSYEALVADPEGETRRMLDYVGLGWDPACLKFHETNRLVRSASNSQVRQKIYTGSSDAWKPFETHLAPLIAGLKPRS
jgi:tetratricopeptide (TPR) repeat protein